MTVKRKLIKAAGTEKTKRKGRPKAIKRKPDAGIAFYPPTGNKAFDNWIAPKRAVAIDRIIKAAGEPPDDENQLAADIEEADTDFAIRLNVKTEKAASHRRALKRIRSSLEKNAKLLDAHPLIKRAAYRHQFSGLRQIIRNIEAYQNRLAMQTRPKEGRQPTPLERLAGVSLPLVYKKRFGGAITFDRDDDGIPKGRLINFVEATMKELGLDYSRESIATAISHFGTLRDSCRE